MLLNLPSTGLRRMACLASYSAVPFFFSFFFLCVCVCVCVFLLFCFVFPLVYHCKLFTSIREISVLWEMEIVNIHPSTESRMNSDKHYTEYISFFIRFRKKIIYISFNQWQAKNILHLQLSLLVYQHNS